VRVLVAAALLLALAATNAAAEDTQVFDLDAKVPIADKSWAELLRQIFPGLRQEAGKDGKLGYVVGGQPNLRPIDKEAFSDGCSDPPPRIEYLDYDRMEISGHMRLVVGITTEYDACFGALALFDGGREAKLLDVANIQQDMHYGYGHDFARRLGPDGELVVAGSFHINTSNSPDNNLLVLVTADKLSPIGYLATEGERQCNRRIDEHPYILITPDYGRFDRITGYVKRTVQRVADDCLTPRGDPVVTITRKDWRWDAARNAYRRAGP
jgi:hypothetical protein